MNSGIVPSLILIVFLASCGGTPPQESWESAMPTDESFSLRYPSDLLDATIDSTSIHLRREVKGPTRSPFCDFEGRADTTSRIVDFDYTFHVSDVEDTSEVTQGEHPWRHGRIQLGGLEGVEDRIGVEGCGERVLTLFVDATQVLTIRGMRLAELRALEARGRLEDTRALSPSRVDSVLDRVVGTLRVSGRSVAVPSE